jgi:hypothetical protein
MKFRNLTFDDLPEPGANDPYVIDTHAPILKIWYRDETKQPKSENLVYIGELVQGELNAQKKVNAKKKVRLHYDIDTFKFTDNNGAEYVGKIDDDATDDEPYVDRITGDKSNDTTYIFRNIYVEKDIKSITSPGVGAGKKSLKKRIRKNKRKTTKKSRKSRK